MSARRTWDKEYYAAKAKERLEKGDDHDHPEAKDSRRSAKEEFQEAPSDAAGPMGSDRAFLKARREKVDLESKVGKTEIINPTNAESASGAGFWCQTCSCLLKDSVSYLDHINGKKHQRALGYSMRSERSNVDQVKDKLDSLKRKIEEQSKKSASKTSAIEEYESRLTAQHLEKEATKKRRKDEVAAKKQERELVELEGCDPELAELLGFGGFGSSKK